MSLQAHLRVQLTPAPLGHHFLEPFVHECYVAAGCADAVELKNIIVASAAVDQTELRLDKPPTVEARFASPDSYPPLRGTTLRGRLTPKITHAPHGSWRTLGELGLIVTLRQLLVQQPMAQARLCQPDAALQTHLLTHHTRCLFAV